MSLFIHSLQLLERGVGVDLRRTDALVTQQVLDAFKSGTIVQHGSGKSMTEHVGGTLLQGRDSRQVVPHNDIDLTIGHPLALVAEEQRPLVNGVLQRPVADFHIVEQGTAQLFTEGNDALLVPFTRHFQMACAEIHIRVIQPYQFRTSQTCLIE